MRIFGSNAKAVALILLGCVVITALVLCPGMMGQTKAQESAPPAERQTPGADPQLPTIFVVGDSTARNSAAGQRGWGDPFADFFDPKKINVLNRARAGRSSRTFITEGLWEKVLQEMKRGDTVLIQFGHNDSGPLETGRARGSLPGTGEEAREVTMPDGRKEVVHTYGWYMRRMIADAKAKGATPMVLSLTVRNIWKDGRVERGSGKFNQWAAEVTRSQDVTFLDLTTLIADRYEQMGQEKVREMFATDYAHTSPAGAELNASLVVAGLKALRKNPLAPYFSAKAKGIGKAKVGKSATARG